MHFYVNELQTITHEDVEKYYVVNNIDTQLIPIHVSLYSYADTRCDLHEPSNLYFFIENREISALQ